jgi:hypothetical protein
MSSLHPEAVQSTPCQRRDLLVRVVDGEALVLDRVRGLVHRFNGTASLIWNRCHGDRDVLEIANDVAAAFNVDPETAHMDVTAAVRRFDELGLLDGVDETAHTAEQASQAG